MFKLTILASLISLGFCCIAHAQELGSWTFADGAQGWTPVNQATVSDVARRSGGRSLMIAQANDSEQNSAWLSPVLKNPGTPIRVSLWAADNYTNQKDHSFAAAFEMVPCDAQGELTGNGGDWTYLPWEDKRQIPQFAHILTREGLRFKHYESTKRTSGEYFRIRLCWPKSLIKGVCYFTDVRVTAVTKEAAASVGTQDKAASDSRFALEISSAANGNLFFAKDPLRFEFLVYTTDGSEVGTLDNAVVRYEITDYEKLAVASGTLTFSGAAPVTHKALKPNPKAKPQPMDRSRNLRLSALIPDASAGQIGREFFLHAKLIVSNQVIAQDTVTYAVVDPKPLPADELDKARFTAFGDGGGFVDSQSAQARQTLGDKMGLSLSQTWDYNGWRKAQPVKDGPITIPAGPEFPKLVYCPNLEQVRGRKPGHPWGDMSKTAPEWALLDDPHHPGCKTFDIDGYVNYIVEYVRTNRHRIVQVIPSGLERFIDARTLELQRKAYAAIKKEFPDLPVGMMTWGVPDNAQQVDLILSEKLYDVADFFNTHAYQSAIGWSEWKRLQRELKKLGIQRRLTSTEFASVGGTDQLQGSRSIVTSVLDAHAHDLYRLTYFLMYVNEVPEAPLRNPVLRGQFPGDGFQWMQYVDRPRVSDAIKSTNWSRGKFGTDERGASLMPMLKTTVYYNLVQALEGADFKAVYQPTDRSIAYVYERQGKTICYLFLREPDAPTTLALSGSVPYVMQDLYGRSDRITPRNASLVVATLDPLLLQFEGSVPALHNAKTAREALRPVDAGLTLPVIARGSTGSAQLRLPPIFGQPITARIEATVDGTWPKSEIRSVPVSSDKNTQTKIPLAVASGQESGTYTFTTRIYQGQELISVLKQPLVVDELLTVELAGLPKTKTQDPAVTLTIRSRADVPMSGKVRIANRFFGSDLEPAAMEAQYTVPAQGTTEFRFPVPREQANLSTSYEMSGTLTDKSGFTLNFEDEVSFQACVKTNTPITIDGNLSDWNLKELEPIAFEKWHRGPRDPKEFSGRFYTRWDNEKLYFAAEITDNTPVVTGITEVGWNDDNIMCCIYPWGWHMGSPLNAGYYREHLGPLKDGKAAINRDGYVAGGPIKADNAQIAVTRTATGWVYEWAYPKSSLSPLVLKTGSAFRLSMSVWDQQKADKKDTQDWGVFSWLTFSGFNTSVNAQPNLWRQFQLIE